LKPQFFKLNFVSRPETEKNVLPDAYFQHEAVEKTAIKFFQDGIQSSNVGAKSLISWRNSARDGNFNLKKT